MPFRVRCSTCGQTCLVPEKLRAASPRCPKCSAVLSVPPPPVPTRPALPESATQTAPAPPELPAKSHAASAHRVVWASIGGAAFAVLALIIGLWYSGARQTDHHEQSPAQPEYQLAAADNGAQVETSALAPPAVTNSPVDLLAELHSLRASERNGSTSLPKDLRDWAEPVLSDEGAVASISPSKPLSPKELYKLVAPAVVTLEIRNDDARVIARGSGFFLDPQTVRRHYRHFPSLEQMARVWTRIEKKTHKSAFVLTNHHVVGPAAYITVTLNDGSSAFVGKVLVEDQTRDLALLHVLLQRENDATALNLAAPIPDVGERVYAVGNPEGLMSSLSDGLVSGIRNERGYTLVQTTTPISHGSSGGPLVTDTGQVVGVTTMSRVSGQNLNFAVAASEVMSVLASNSGGRETWRGASIEHELQDAFTDLLVYCASNPNDKDAETLYQAQSLVKRHEFADALQRVEALQRVPEQFSYLLHLTEASAHYGLMLYPQDATNINDLHRKTRESVRYRAAEKVLLAAEAKKPFAPTYYKLARLYYRGGEWINALQRAERLVSLVPRCADAYRIRGLCQMALKSTAGALQDFQRCIGLDATVPEDHENLARAFVDLGEYNRAVDAYQSAISLGHTAPALCYFGIGVALERARNYDRAITAFEKAKAEGAPPDWCDANLAECRRKLRQE